MTFATTSPGTGCGSAMSARTSSDGGPNRSQRTAFTRTLRWFGLHIAEFHQHCHRDFRAWGGMEVSIMWRIAAAALSIALTMPIAAIAQQPPKPAAPQQTPKP